MTKAVLIEDATQIVVQQAIGKLASSKLPQEGHTWMDTDQECVPGMIKVGESFELPPKPAPVPQEFTLDRRQFMWIIYDNDLEGDIQALIAGLGQAAKAKAKAYLLEGSTFNRDDQYITALINHLGHTSAQWDAWWMTAKDE